MTSHNEPDGAVPPPAAAAPVEPSPAQAQAHSPYPPGIDVPEDDETGSPLVGVLAALGLGLGAAVLYAIVTTISGREFSLLAVLIGFAVAFGFSLGRVKGIVWGVVAAIIAAVMFFVAMFASMAGLDSKEYGVSFFESLDLYVSHASEVVELYFEDPMSYLFLGITVVVAFVSASGIRNRGDSA